MNPPANPPAPLSAPLQPLKSFSVSVLVPTFNRANYIAECLDSLLAQTLPALEIVVIDDGSEDGTAEVLRGYGDSIRYVRKENGGKPTAVNLGLSLAKGELIWIFDDDDVALHDAIANRVAALKAAPAAGFVYTPHYYGRSGPGGKIQLGRLHSVPLYAPDRLLFELMKGCFLSLSSALVRADVYRVMGGFDTALLRSQDYDMALRLTRTYPATYSDTPSFIVREHEGIRGPKIARTTGLQRSKSFHRFDQRIGLKLRETLSLGDYLIPKLTTIPNQDLCRQALLARMTVMASKGCLHEMIEDIKGVADTFPPKHAVDLATKAAIAEAICTGYANNAITTHWDEFKEMLASFPNSAVNRSIFRAIATGLLRLAKSYPGSIIERFAWVKQSLYLVIFSIHLR